MFRIPSALLSLAALVWAVADAPIRPTGGAPHLQQLTDAFIEGGNFDSSRLHGSYEAGAPGFLDQPFAETGHTLAMWLGEEEIPQLAQVNNWLETVLDPHVEPAITALASLPSAGAPHGRAYFSALGGYPGGRGGSPGGGMGAGIGGGIESLPGSAPASGGQSGSASPTPTKPSEETPGNPSSSNEEPGNGGPGHEQPGHEQPGHEEPGPGHEEPGNPSWQDPGLPGPGPIDQGPPPVSVPEPGSLGLFALGLAGMAALRRRRAGSRVTRD